jgi:hypothetical protein
LWALHSSGRELGVLELQRFLIKERAASAPAANTYGIFEPQTQDQVGIAREELGSLWRFLRSFLSRKLEVRETEDESLVFTVHRTVGWWRRRLEVYDADDYLIGYGEDRTVSGRDGFWISDRRGLPFAEVKESLRGRGCLFLGPDGRELGAVTSEWTGTGNESRASANHYLMSIGEELAEQPFAKMLLLGAALAVHIIPRRKAN